MKLSEAPALVRTFCLNHSGWLIGGAAKALINKEAISSIKDWDVMIPFSEWHQACLLIPVTAFSNKFGGWKIVSKGRETKIDVWPDSLDKCVTNYPETGYFLHPLSGKYFITGHVSNVQKEISNEGQENRVFGEESI